MDSTACDTATSSSSHHQSPSRPEYPLRNTNVISRLFFTYAYPLLRIGLTRPLQEEDLPDIHTSDTSAEGLALFLKLISSQQNEKNSKDNQLYVPLIRSYIQSLKWTQVKLAFYISSMIVQAVALGKLLENFSLQSSHKSVNRNLSILHSSSTSSHGFFWATVLVLCGAIMILSTHSLYFDLWVIGMRMRLAAVASIFDKTLRLPSIGTFPMSHQSRNDTTNTKTSSPHSSTTSTTTGRIMNLASSDAERFILACVFGPYLVWGPIHAILVFIVGCTVLGSIIPFIFGYVLLFLFSIVQYYMSQRFAYYRSSIAAITDQRVHLLSQVITGVRVMKINGWEDAFVRRIQDIREREISMIQRATRLRAMNEAIFFASSVTICIIIFVVHVFLQNRKGGENRENASVLSTGKIYTIFALMNALQFTMVKYFSIAVMSVSECSVSFKRIATFLSFPEKECGNIAHNSSWHSQNPNIIVSFQNVTCYWNNVHLIQRKENGKDSTESVGSTVLSTRQETPWPVKELESGDSIAIETVPMAEESAMEGCIKALDSVSLDISVGELCCVIGAVGSGKSALLQAIASELPVSLGILRLNHQTISYASQEPWIINSTVRENILLGAPFDQEWYDQIIQSCGLDVDLHSLRNGDSTLIGDRGVQVSGGQRARISLARALYRNADLVLLDDPLSAVDSKTGRLIYNAAIQSLAVKRGKTVVLATHQHQFIRGEKCVAMNAGKVVCVGSYLACMERLRDARGDRLSTASANLDNVDEGDVLTDDERMGPVNPIAELKDTVLSSDDDQKEFREKGKVSWLTWKNYLRALGGHKVSVLLLSIFLCTQSSLILTVAMTGRWARDLTNLTTSGSKLQTVAYLCVALTILSFCRSIVYFRVAIAASKRLHDEVTWKVVRATVTFFDTNPVGRILNRFSADIGVTDDSLPLTLFDFLVTAFMVVGGVATAIYVIPFTLISLPLLVFFFMQSRRVFVSSSREIKRLEGLARSPIFDALTESLSGVACIRSNNADGFFRKKFETAHNCHSRAFFAFIFSSRWLGIRIDCIMFTVTSISSYLAVLCSETGWFRVEPVTIGLALSMLLQMGDVAQWCVRQSAEVTNQMISVERLLQYSSLPSEAPLTTDFDWSCDSSWPMSGSITVQNLSVRYRPSLPLSLQNISVDIKPGQHVGVVGRTGSGKSTLVQSFLRLIEADGGKIFIDDIDISQVGLHRLRRGIAVINQVPTLYGSVTLRENLDPFGCYSDEDICQALSDVQMIHVVDSLHGGLNSLVAESGSNFSVGQRQLLCLARAILRKSKILVLDEPTANVDTRTEQLLQDAIFQSFDRATIISVAHRLDTVIESDQILVLGNGILLESGAPSDLLSGRSGYGYFASLVDETGVETAKELRLRAQGRRSQ